MSESRAEDQAFLKELRDEFLESARVDLDDWESNFLDYESGDDDKMKDLRRLIHSMKGSSQAIGLVDLGECLHELENWLSMAETQRSAQQIVSTGLAFVDQLRSYCSLMTKGQDGSATVQSLRQLLV